jgi:hypothetical protein
MTSLSDQIYFKYARKLGPDQIASPKALSVIDHFLCEFLKTYGSDKNSQSLNLVKTKKTEKKSKAGESENRGGYNSRNRFWDWNNN